MLDSYAVNLGAGVANLHLSGRPARGEVGETLCRRRGVLLPPPRLSGLCRECIAVTREGLYEVPSGVLA